jgi:AraC-like DNA-binding protein
MQVYSLDRENIFLSQEFIRKTILEKQPHIILKRKNSNPYAEKLKNKIDESFLSNIDLSAFAKELNISKEWLIKYFKKDFHITPIAYRNKKRLMEAFLRLHLNKETVLELSHQVGFNDLKQFNTLFKTNMRTQPSKFSK